MSPQERILRQQISQLDSRIRQASQQNQLLSSAAQKRVKTLSQGFGQVDNNATQPGNLGKLSDVLWPFIFTARDVNRAPVILIPGETEIGSFSVTQDSGFVMMAYQKSVFIEDDQNAGQFSYLDPRQPDNSGKSPGLFFTFRDAQSSRVFHDDAMKVDCAGFWEKPTVLQTPMLILPNNLFEIEYTNNDADNTYAVHFSFIGYRIRLQNGDQILSTVVG